MSKTSVLRGSIILKEFSPTEVAGNRILTYDSSTGLITDAPPIDTSTFISATLASGSILVGNVSNEATAVAVSGDITLSNAGVAAIATGVIINTDISGSAAIAYSKLNLTGSLLNADVNASAGIVYSKLNLTGGVLNADINASAAIARSKTAAGTAYRILANNVSGVMSENAALTASRAIGSDTNGQLQSLTTTITQVNYLSNTTGDIQAQLDDLIATNPVEALVKSPTVAEHGYAITWNNTSGEWNLTDPVVQGLPAGGTTRQSLLKTDATDWNTDWYSLVLTDISDVSASVADVNVLLGADAAGITPTILGYIATLTSDAQDQFDNKLGSALAHNAVFVGNASNVATAVAAGSSGQVFTVVGGVPSWATPSIGASGGSADEIQKNDGASGFAGTKVYSTTDGNLRLGDSGLAGPLRSITTLGSSADVSLYISPTGTGELRMYSSTGGQVLFSSNNEIACESSGSLPFRMQRDTSVTNAVSYVAKLTHITSGTPAAGIGTGLQFETETAAGNNEVGAIIEAVTTDVTSTSEDFDLVFKTMAAGAAAAERVRINASQITFTLSGEVVKITTSGIDLSSNSTGSISGLSYLVGRDGLSITSNSVTGSSNAGATLINGGDSVDGFAGDIIIDTGEASGTGTDGNIALLTSSVPNWQAMEKGVFIANATTIPTGNPTGGGFLYVEAGSLRFRGTSGTVTVIAPA